jgi:formiminotetrahydrofolate cyclodeaminase
VVAAFRLPKATEEEKATRSAAVQAALRGATETPLSVMRACEAVIRAGDAVATSGNPSASSDVQVGFELALAGLRGARLNVEINLGSVKDTAFVGAVREEVARLVRDADSGVTRARSHAG